MGTKLSGMFTEIENALSNARKDLEKFESGNRSAGTRVRSSMMEIKKIAQEVRNAVTEAKKK
jgi:flagellar hook-basal body complex protein FliE